MPGAAEAIAPGVHLPLIFPVLLLLSLHSSSRNCLCHSSGLSHMGHIFNEWFHSSVIYLTNQTRTPQIEGPWVEFSSYTCFVWPTPCFWRIWINCQPFLKIRGWHIIKIWISDFSWQTESLTMLEQHSKMVSISCSCVMTIPSEARCPFHFCRVPITPLSCVWPLLTPS